TLRSVGSSLLRSHRYREAEAFYRPAVKLQRTFPGSTKSDINAVYGGLARALEAQHKDADLLEVFREGAELAGPDVMRRLGEMYQMGHGVARDEREAANWYRKAANQGSATAQFLLGQMYASGRGVTRDETQASEWFRKVNESIDAWDLNDLAWTLATTKD